MDLTHFFDESHILENDRARLEPLEEKHFNLLLSIAMQEAIWEFTLAKIKTAADFRVYFDIVLKERKDGLSYPFAIYDKQNNCYGGCTRFANIAFPHRKLEIGWTWYHPNLQRTGLNRNCKFLLLSFGFEQLDLNRIELKTSSLNIKSQAAMSKIGAVKEGTLRQNFIADNGVVRDTVYFSFLREEWPGVKDRIFVGF